MICTRGRGHGYRRRDVIEIYRPYKAKTAIIKCPSAINNIITLFAARICCYLFYFIFFSYRDPIRTIITLPVLSPYFRQRARQSFPILPVDERRENSPSLRRFRGTIVRLHFDVENMSTVNGWQSKRNSRISSEDQTETEVYRTRMPIVRLFFLFFAKHFIRREI